MSLRAFTRLLLLSLAGLILAPPLLWSQLGAWSLLAGPGLLLASSLALLSLAVRPAPTRWQLRYHLPQARAADLLPREGPEARLAAMLRFLYRRTPLALEAQAGGLFLELPPAFDEYVTVQIPLALPEARLTRVEAVRGRRPAAYYLALDADAAEALRWATQSQGRQVRAHLRADSVTLAAATDGERPPGRWLRIPLPALAARLWDSLPLWNELSTPADDKLLPTTEEGDVYDSRSSMLKLAPPPDYEPAGEGRILGRATGGQAVRLNPDLPLFVAGAPEEFLVQQAVQDLAQGGVVVVSPHRSVLKQIRRRAGAEVPVPSTSSEPALSLSKGQALWLDLDNSQASAHLAIANAADWKDLSRDDLDEMALALLRALGFHVHVPALADVARCLIHTLADSARLAGVDLPFTDLYAVSQSAQALRAFLHDLHDSFPDPAQPIHGDVTALLDLLATEQGPGYMQVTSLQTAIRTALRPLRAGPLHILCQPPFADLGNHLARGGLLLVPLAGEFVDHHRLLSLFLDLVLRRVLATAGPDFHLALHLHEPHLYRESTHAWREAADNDERLSLLVAFQEPGDYRSPLPSNLDAELIFRCPRPLATRLANDWQLPPGSAADLAELPPDVALARLPGMTITLTTEGSL